MIWSHRVDANLAANRLTTTLQALRAAGRPILDLTLSNPTAAGFRYPHDMLRPLADRRGLLGRRRLLGLRLLGRRLGGSGGGLLVLVAARDGEEREAGEQDGQEQSGLGHGAAG